MRLRNVCARRETILEASIEEVWAALTDPERLADWFATEVELVAEPGGAGVFRWANGEERRAVVHEVVPGERLAFGWEGEDGVASTVELELREVAGGTELTVTETAVPADTLPPTDWSVAVGLGALARHLAPVLV